MQGYGPSFQAIMSIGMATNVVWCETEKGANNTKVVVCTNAIESYSPDFDSFRSFTLYSAGLQLAIAGLYTTAILRVPEAKRFAAVHVATRILAGITWILLGLVHPATAAVVPVVVCRKPQASGRWRGGSASAQGAARHPQKRRMRVLLLM